MKFEFTDIISGDKWIEEYESIEEIKPEMLEGISYKMVFECSKCNKTVKTKKIEKYNLGFCKKCK